MAKLKKIYLVTATHHPYHELWMKIAKDLSEKLNTELEVRYEDYLFLIEHGDVDEYGMAWLPQIVAEFDDGSYRVLLSQLPLNEALQPDPNKALEIMISRVREVESGQ